MELIKKLPLYKEFNQIKKNWRLNSHFLVKSPTGSGKSIALPLLLVNTGLVKGKVMVVQPRRLAARMLSKQVAKISGWSLGQEVGYHVRFDACYSEKTRILYVTDGIAEKKLLTGEGLDDVEVIILDEFHERSAQIDLCLSLALAIWDKSRPDLRIFVTSATLDLNLLGNFIPQSVPIELSQRSFPVEIDYSGPRKEKFFWQEVVRILPSILTKHTGDILIFMDGAYEISRAIDQILKNSWSRGVDIFPLYGDLSPELQDKALAQGKKRKIILSTNIAETSLTVEGIKVVIDSGRAKKLVYDSNRGLNRLVSEPICQSSAQQRTGRAGRTSPGYCLRLWSEKENQTRPEFDVPEICRIDLSQIYLNLMGVSLSFKDLKLLDSVPEGNIEKAKLSLRAIGAIDHNNTLTNHGKKISRLPIHPSWGHALLIAKDRGYASMIAILLAMLDERPPVEADKLADFDYSGHPRSDPFCLLLAYEAAKRNKFSLDYCRNFGIHAQRCRDAEKVASSLCQMVEEKFLPLIPGYEEFAKTLLCCFPLAISHIVSAGRSIYQDSQGRNLHLSKRSVVKNEKFLLPLKLLGKKLSGTMVTEMEFASGLNESWIRESLGDRIKKSNEVFLDLLSRRVISKTTEGWQEFILTQKETESTSQSDRTQAYAKALNNGEIKLKHWGKREENFLLRTSFLSSMFPEFGIKELDEDSRLLFFEQFCQSGTWKEIRNREVYEPLTACYSDEDLRVLDQAVPERMSLGLGKRYYDLDYSKGVEVILRAKLQDFYDLEEHPSIVFGKYPLIVELLAPNQRSIQRTSDLPGFWKGSYLMVRKELAGRYPKHEWR